MRERVGIQAFRAFQASNSPGELFYVLVPHLGPEMVSEGICPGNGL